MAEKEYLLDYIKELDKKLATKFGQDAFIADEKYYKKIAADPLNLEKEKKNKERILQIPETDYEDFVKKKKAADFVKNLYGGEDTGTLGEAETGILKKIKDFGRGVVQQGKNVALATTKLIPPIVSTIGELYTDQ